MIISDTHGFVFVHIPKCGGTSVRSALARYDDRAEQYYDKGRATHPVLGDLDHHHIPLSVLRENFPEDFECVKRYTSFAIVRDPFERFPSSVFQRLRATNAEKLSSEDVRAEVDAVIGRLLALSPGEPVLEPDLIHFSRQQDYVSLDGNRIVDNVFALNGIPELISAVSGLTGEIISPVQRENERLRFSNALLASADRWVQARIMNNLPRRAWKPVFTLAKGGLMRTGVLKRSNDWHGAVFQSEDVQRFIREFYANDISLFSECCAKSKDGLGIQK